MIPRDLIEIAAKLSFDKQSDPEQSAYECFFHYTDEKLYAAGFEEGITSEIAREYWEEQFKNLNK